MACAFITGTVSVGKASCSSAGVTCSGASVSTLDGTFMCMVHRPGTYAFTAHAPGHTAVTKKIKIAKLDGKAKSVFFKIRPD